MLVDLQFFRAETNTSNTQVLVKDFGTQIVKLVYEYLLRSHDLVHLPSASDTMKAIEFYWRNTNISTFNTVCIIFVT